MYIEREREREREIIFSIRGGVLQVLEPPSERRHEGEALAICVYIYIYIMYVYVCIYI